MAADWYRSAAWDEAAQAEFGQRTGRATSRRRPEIMRIKGVYLFNGGEVVGALAVWLRVVDEYPESSAANHAREMIGQAYQWLGDLDAAEATYRDVLAREQKAGRVWNTSGVTELFLAEVLLRRGTPEALAEVGSLLKAAAPRPHLKFSTSTYFRCAVASARFAALTGHEDPVPLAEAALVLAENGKAEFLRGPGHVLESVDTLVKEMQEIAGVRPPTRRSLRLSRAPRER